jgi:hypothetical protein
MVLLYSKETSQNRPSIRYLENGFSNRGIGDDRKVEGYPYTKLDNISYLLPC